MAPLLADDGVIDDQFGWSVSILGDTVLVGARNEGLAGAAYVFERVVTSWSQQAKLTGGAVSGGSFGSSVDMTTLQTTSPPDCPDG